MNDVVALLDLPSDLWTHILDGLYEHDALMLQSTNKRLFKLCDKKFGWICPNDCTMRYFAKIGAISCLKYIHDTGIEWGQYIITSAAKQGQLETIKFLHQNGCDKDSSACKEAAANNHLECLRYMHENGFPWDESVFEAAVGSSKSGNLEMLKYVHENGCPWKSSILTVAARVNLDCLKFVLDVVDSSTIETHDFSYVYSRFNVCSFAALGDNIATLKYLDEDGFLIDGSCSRAAVVGSLECLKYAHEHGDQWGNTIQNAAEHGHTECIRYALENGDRSLVDIGIAVSSGNIECVKLLAEHGARWKGEEYEIASSFNHLDMVKYLLEVVHRPKPTTNRACMWAAGNLSVLKYLHENGFSWDGRFRSPNYALDIEVEPSHTIVFQAVGVFQSLPCLKYIHECGYELDTNDLSLCNAAAHVNNVEILAFLISIGCKMHHSIMEVAAREGALKAIRYLHKSGTDLHEGVAMSAAKWGRTRVLEYALKHGYGLNSDVCALAAAHGKVKCLMLAHKYGVPFTANTMLEATKGDLFNLDCIRYLHENGCEWSHQECNNVTKDRFGDIIFDQDLIALKYMHEHGSQWNEETWYNAVNYDSVECLEYLFANGCPQDPRTFDMTDREKCYAFMQQHNIVPNTKDDQK